MTDRSPQIRELNEQIHWAFEKSKDWAIEAGRLLTEQKAELKHGEWGPWLEANIIGPKFSRSQVNHFMKLYQLRDELKILESRNLSTAIKLAYTEYVPQVSDKLDENKIADPVPSYELFYDDATEVEYEALIEEVKPVLQTTADEDSVINAFRFVKLMKEATDAGSPLAAYLAIKLGPAKLKALFERVALQSADNGDHDA